MELSVDVTDAVALELKERRPRMHPFKLGAGAYVGAFKYHGLTDTVLLRSEPGLYKDAERAYADVVSGAPFACLDEAIACLGLDISDSSFLDITCATGLYSFHLAARLTKHVR